MSLRKTVEWIGSSKDDLREFPHEVRRVIGQAINDAELGGEHPAAKALKRFGGRSVLEIVDDFDGDTYRAVIHRALRGRPVCPSYLSEESQERHRDPTA